MSGGLDVKLKVELFEQKCHDFINILFEVSHFYCKIVISLLATEWRHNE
jgi:hypothetical protein